MDRENLKKLTLGWRVVHTGVEATNKNIEILLSVIGQMSDGIWENSNGMTSYWSDANICIVDNEVVINVENKHSIMEKDYSFRSNGYTYKWRKNKYNDMSDSDIVRFFSNKIRAIVRQNDKDNKELAEMPEEKFRRYYSPTAKRPERIDFGFRADNTNECNYLNYDETVTVGDAFRVFKTMRDYANI